MENYTILAVFMGIDILTGLIKVWRVEGGSSIKSRKIQAGVISKAFILIIPIIIVWSGRGVGIDLSWFGHGALGMLILAEAYSIIGNIHAISRKEEKAEFDAVSFVLNKIKAIIENLIVERKIK
jgi:phage-related holin